MACSVAIVAQVAQMVKQSDLRWAVMMHVLVPMQCTSKQRCNEQLVTSLEKIGAAMCIGSMPAQVSDSTLSA